MKKIAIVFFLTGFTILLHAQVRDSIAVQAELQQLDNIRDSLARAQLEKSGIAIPLNPGNGQEVPSEMQANFDKIIKQQDNERRIFSNKLLLVTAFIFIVLIGMIIVLNKQHQKKRRTKNR